VAKFTRAWESADLDALVALLTGDVFIAMPPVPFGYEGRDAVTRYCARQFTAGRRFDLVPVRANGQPAFGAYLRGPAGIRHATAFYVLTLAGGQICALTRFEATVLPWFGLPRSLPSPAGMAFPSRVSGGRWAAAQDVNVGSAGCGVATRPLGSSQSSCRPSAVRSSSAYAPMVGSDPRA
jgi:SnoaL-like domain